MGAEEEDAETDAAEEAAAAEEGAAGAARPPRHPNEGRPRAPSKDVFRLCRERPSLPTGREARRRCRSRGCVTTLPNP